MAAPIQTQTPVGSIDPQAEAPVSLAPLHSSAQLDPLRKLDELVAGALTADEAARKKLSGEINAMMKLARETVGGRRVADELLALLHSKKLQDFVAPDGKSCRSMAVEQLLALGFPFALEVMPKDLTYHREHEKTLGPFARIALAMMALLSAGLPFTQLLPRALRDASVLWDSLPAAAGVGVITAFIALLLIPLRPASRRAKWLRRSLWLAGAVGLFIGGLNGVPFAMWPGAVAALVAGAFLPSEPREG